MSKYLTQEAIELRNSLWAKLVALGDPRTKVSVLDNAILDTDSYKLCHASMYSVFGCTASEAYIEPRIKNEEILFFGLNIWLKNFKPITMEMVDQAEEFFKLHIVDGEKLFPRAAWEKVVNVYGGYPPIEIHAVPEGTVIPSQNALVILKSKDPELAWMVSYFEPQILRAVWYPTSIASRSRKIRKILRSFIRKTSDVDVDAATMFQHHDFGARGVSSKESASIGALAHLAAGSYGTDTCTGILYANEYYAGGPMAAYSVAATEHSIMTMNGKEGEVQAVYDMIKTFAKRPGTIVSIVSDGYDIFNLAQEYCNPYLKNLIIETGTKLVIRPDSGDAVEVISKLLDIFEAGYGVTTNSKGYKVINVVRILQGDGLSEVSDFTDILEMVKAKGFSTENIVFGQGGGLLQQINRDTYKFAMKTCAAELNGVWVDVFKDPVTDQGKKSKKGRLAVVVNDDGSIETVRVEEVNGRTEMTKKVWDTGELLVDYTLEEIRKSAIAD